MSPAREALGVETFRRGQQNTHDRPPHPGDAGLQA
jgi:hypothetical protein